MATAVWAQGSRFVDKEDGFSIEPMQGWHEVELERFGTSRLKYMITSDDVPEGAPHPVAMVSIEDSAGTRVVSQDYVRTMLAQSKQILLSYRMVHYGPDIVGGRFVATAMAESGLSKQTGTVIVYHGRTIAIQATCPVDQWERWAPAFDQFEDSFRVE
jgi:hypothetical protein